MTRVSRVLAATVRALTVTPALPLATTALAFTTTATTATTATITTITAFVAATPAAATAQATAQAAPQAAPQVDGRWDARWASGIRTERDGSVTVQREADAVLRLESHGDSVFGTWTFEFPGTGRSVWFVRGHLRDGRLTLVATEHETEIPPPPGQEVLRQEWSGAVAGSRMEGEMWLVLGLPDGSERRSGPRPWSAARSPD